MCVCVCIKKAFECDGVPFTSFLDRQLAGVDALGIAVGKLHLGQLLDRTHAMLHGGGGSTATYELSKRCD